MRNYSLDYNHLDNSINKVEKKIYKLADVKDKIEKVAFDIVRFKDADPDELWQVQNADDGSYIIARYTDEPAAPVKSASVNTNHWAVLINHANDLNVFYKGQHITKIAFADLELPTSDRDLAQRALAQKLYSDPGFLKALIVTFDADTKSQLAKQFPELFSK
jgi:hypothetical protein